MIGTGKEVSLWEKENVFVQGTKEKEKSLDYFEQPNSEQYTYVYDNLRIWPV